MILEVEVCIMVGEAELAVLLVEVLHVIFEI